MNRRFTLGNIGTLTLNFKAGFLALVFMIASAYAMPAEAFRGRKAPDPERIITNLTRELGLSETQVAQVRPIIENQVEQRKSIFEKYSSQGRDGRQAMRGEMDTLRNETKTQMASVLTDEQMAKYEAFQEQRWQKKGDRRQRGEKQNRGRRAPDPERIIANLTRELGLSETQVAQVRPIIENQVEQRKSIFEKYSSQGRDGRQAMRGETETLRNETKTQMASVLTEEQMAKYEAFQEQRRQKKGARGQRGKRQNF